MDAIEQEAFELRYDDEPERVVRGRIVAPAGRRRGGAALPWVLVLHGFKGFMDWGFFPELHRRLAARGMAAVAFNHSGSGIGPDLESFDDQPGFFAGTLSRELADVARVAAYARAAPGLDPERFGLLGHSRGGAQALIHAAEHRGACAIVTWAALERHGRCDAATIEEWRRRGWIEVVNARTGQALRWSAAALDDLERNQERLDVIAAAGRVDAPVLLVHGTADESVDASAAEALAAALPPGRGRRMLVEGAGHTFGARHPLEGVPPALEAVLRASVEHLAEHLL